MITIDVKKNYFTLINVFTVDRPNQQKLVNLLTQATDGRVSKVPGFIAAALHQSIDGTKVTIYAQWESQEHYQQMRSNPQASANLDEALRIASFDPGMYEVVKTFN